MTYALPPHLTVPRSKIASRYELALSDGEPERISILDIFTFAEQYKPLSEKMFSGIDVEALTAKMKNPCIDEIDVHHCKRCLTGVVRDMFTAYVQSLWAPCLASPLFITVEDIEFKLCDGVLSMICTVFYLGTTIRRVFCVVSNDMDENITSARDVFARILEHSRQLLDLDYSDIFVAETNYKALCAQQSACVCTNPRCNN